CRRERVLLVCERQPTARHRDDRRHLRWRHSRKSRDRYRGQPGFGHQRQRHHDLDVHRPPGRNRPGPDDLPRHHPAGRRAAVHARPVAARHAPPPAPRTTTTHLEEPLMTTALVTGGAGFIGSHVVDHLIDQLGIEVVVLDDLSGGFRENVHPKARLVEGSIVDDALVTRLFTRHRFDYGYHLAAYAA